MRKAIEAACAAAATAIVIALPAGAGTSTAPRPTYSAAEATVSSPYVVVHYTRTGADHPRFMKDDNGNGVPNYIEKLAVAANNEAHLATHGSLQQTVAHELFHVFQSSYVPNGAIPAWAAEGSALAMQTYVYPQIVDATSLDYLGHWLDQPRA